MRCQPSCFLVFIIITVRLCIPVDYPVGVPGRVLSCSMWYISIPGTRYLVHVFVIVVVLVSFILNSQFFGINKYSNKNQKTPVTRQKHRYEVHNYSRYDRRSCCNRTNNTDTFTKYLHWCCMLWCWYDVECGIK